MPNSACASRAALLVPLLVACLAASPARAEAPVRTSDIVKETSRTEAVGRRIVNFWWLPLEYWVAAARELGQTEKQIAEVRGLFRDYQLLAVIDAEVLPDGTMKPLATAEIVRRASIQLDGRPTEVLRQVHPRLQELIPSLAYVLQASLGPMGAGLRVLPLRGVDDEGNVVMSGVVRGRLRVDYEADPTAERLEFFWRGPLTAVVGPKHCPGSGEPMEAHWLFCPWSGQRVP